MAALTQERITKELASDGKFRSDPIAADTVVYRGGLTGLDASGNVVPAAPTVPVLRGVAVDTVDNTGGAAGAWPVASKAGTFCFNQTGLDRTDIGSDVFVVDDNTVGATGTLVAGELVQIDDAGAWVRIV